MVVPWRRNVLDRGKQQRRARDRQTWHHGKIGRSPMGLRLRTINLMQFGARAATAMRRGHARSAATAAHLLAASAFGGRHLRSGKRAGHRRREKRHQRKESRPNSRDDVHCYQRSESRPARRLPASRAHSVAHDSSCRRAVHCPRSAKATAGALKRTPPYAYGFRSFFSSNAALLFNSSSRRRSSSAELIAL